MLKSVSHTLEELSNPQIAWLVLRRFVRSLADPKRSASRHALLMHQKPRQCLPNEANTFPSFVTKPNTSPLIMFPAYNFGASLQKRSRVDSRRLHRGRVR